jgi:nitroimidazol reductase NimA-like FMN-containing flavoprotein (pyridoxamine 5'-phosphate oxidase superfamily)
MGFKKIKILSQNPKVSLEFYRKNQFTAKTNRKFVFFGRGPYISDRLYIMVMYISFYGL